MKALVKPKPEMYNAWPKGFQYIDKRRKSGGRTTFSSRVVAAGICGTDVGIYHSRIR
jgi:threonine dehydrogenase-like Zn-dependent dehydrogenase